MSIQTINLGTYANDGTGDDLRSAFQKVNANLIELYSTVSGCNIGSVPPTSGVEQGELWWSTVDGRLYVKYGTAWIETNPAAPPVNYDITAVATTGGVNLRLGGTDLTEDNIKIAAGENIIVTRTDANTITLSIPSFTGNVTGDLTGNVTGDLTGNVTGDTTGTHNGDVVGNVTGNLIGLHTGDVVGNVTGDITGNLIGDTTGTHTGPLNGNANTATKFIIASNINGVAFDGSQDIVVSASADTLYGTSLNSTVVNSSLTSVGTLTDLTVTNTIIGSVSSISNHALADLSNVDSTSPTNGQALTWSDTLSKWTPGTGGSGLTQVENDTSPKLGGNLNLNGYNIIGVGDVQTTVRGIDVVILDSLVAFMLETNAITVDMGDFSTAGYPLDMNGTTFDGFTGNPPTNIVDFGSFA
jgi:hypothetical protein